MTAPAQSPPRFLPTLTEVVQPAAVLKDRPGTNSRTEEIVQSVLQALEPSLESRLLQGLDTILLEQLEALELRLQQKIRQVLREAVLEMVEQQMQGQATEN